VVDGLTVGVGVGRATVQVGRGEAVRPGGTGKDTVTSRMFDTLSPPAAGGATQPITISITRRDRKFAVEVRLDERIVFGLYSNKTGV
jgi:hypothetical protein